MSTQHKVPTPILPPEIFDSLPEVVRHYILFLEGKVQQLESRVQQLEQQVHSLQAQISKNSSNSSKPPSSGGLKRPPKSQRVSSGKKSGGQGGHVGKNLAQVENPDHIKVHTPESCQGCGSDLSHILGSCIGKRQVFDIPQPQIEVTEHQVEEKKCPCCGVVSRALFPENVRGPSQYGERVQALAAYFAHQHFIPVERVGQIFEDIFGITISPGTCANIDERLFEKLGIFEAGLKAYLIAAEVLHFDETGMRCTKKLHWVHVASSQTATLYTMHLKRGKEAMDEADILPQFKGTAIHDHWFPYFSYNEAKHGLCNAHHLRELTFIHEQGEDWGKKMKELLIFAKNEVEKYFAQGQLPKEILLHIETTYVQILKEGFEYHSRLPPLPKGKRGRQKQRDGKNFLDRLQEKRESVLLFVYDFSISFTNNLGEQDIRMVKLKQKIAGCFRTSRGGQIFCRIRSYISTARKQGWGIWNALAEAIRGRPLLLEPILIPLAQSA